MFREQVIMVSGPLKPSMALKVIWCRPHSISNTVHLPPNFLLGLFVAISKHMLFLPVNAVLSAGCTKRSCSAFA